MSNIEWCDKTWNPVTGCTKVSPGCAHCYAETWEHRFQRKGEARLPWALSKARGGRGVTLHPERLDLPLRWKEPCRVFVNSMSDLFHEDVPDEFILQVWVTMAMCQEHTFQILTKRPERMRDVLSRQFLPDTLKTVLGPGARILAKGFWPLPNVWLGTSVENQRQADRRIPQLLQTPAAVRWLSMEPLLGPVDLRNWLGCSGVGPNGYFVAGQGLDWQVIGGESGPKARRMDSEWALSLIQQGRAAGVPTFFKQPGTVLSREWGLRGKGGGDFESFPPEFRVREYPAERVGA